MVFFFSIDVVFGDIVINSGMWSFGGIPGGILVQCCRL